MLTQNAVGSYTSAVACLLSAAVNGYDNVQAGIEFLAGKHVAKFLSELLELKVHIVDPRNGATGYELALLTHVSWLIDFDTGARELSTLGIVESVRTTAFQRIYNQGLKALAAAERFSSSC